MKQKILFLSLIFAFANNLRAQNELQHAVYYELGGGSFVDGIGYDVRGNIGAVHGHILTLLHMAQRQSRLHQSLLKRERAAQNEGHQIAAPKHGNIGRLTHHIAMVIYAIPWQVDANINVVTQAGQKWIAGLGHSQ